MKIASVTPIFASESLVKIGPTGTNRQTDGQIETRHVDMSFYMHFLKSCYFKLQADTSTLVVCIDCIHIYLQSYKVKRTMNCLNRKCDR